LNSDLYALIALAARYWFVALIVALLFRGWRMTVADNRRAKLLREWMGQTGCVGELILNPGSKKRVSYPIPREGVLGSGFSADVRIRHRDVRRAHAHFELREGGLLMKPLGRAELAVGGGFTGAAVFLRDGDVLTVGKLQLMLVLFDAPAEEEEDAGDEWFEAESDAAPEDDATDEPYERQPEDMYAQPLPDDGDKQTAKRARKAPVSLGGQFTRTPTGRQRPAKRGRKPAPDFELPFDLNEPRPAPGRAHSDGGGEQSGGAKRAKGRRAQPVAQKDDFNEDAIWPDL